MICAQELGELDIFCRIEEANYQLEFCEGKYNILIVGPAGGAYENNVTDINILLNKYTDLKMKNN